MYLFLFIWEINAINYLINGKYIIQFLKNLNILNSSTSKMHTKYNNVNIL